VDPKQAQAERVQVRYGGLLEKIFKLVLAEDRGSVGASVLRTIATLLAWPYGWLIKLRNFLFECGILKVKKLDCRVISVGNLVVGGTGKTPMVLWLAQFLYEEGLRVAVVSRGYRGDHAGGPLVVSDGQHLHTDGRLSGDEPQLLARRLPTIPVLCSAKRAVAVEAAIREFKSDVVILDDGFQHRSVGRDLAIVMLDAVNPFGNGRLFPRGIMREQATALARAQALVLSRFDSSYQAQHNLEDLLSRWPDKQIFRAVHSPSRLFEVVSDEDKPLSSLKQVRTAAFAGIAQPDDFFASLVGLGAELVYANALPDHHPLSRGLLESFLQEASGLEPELWVITEKDWVRLPEDLPDGMNLWVLAIDLNLGEESSHFKKMVRESVEMAAVTLRSIV
jgi:tetraacyldisaccharide 4'-kinase